VKQIGMHIHSFSLRYQFRYRDDFDVFSFIDLAVSEGFTGVNISANGPGYRDLGGTMPEHFARVKKAVQSSGLRCELDTSDTNPENMERMIAVAQAIGADYLRTYTRYPGDNPDLIEQTIADLRAIASLAEQSGVCVVLENHEDFLGPQIVEIVNSVNHPAIRALYDFGNAQMVGEDPHAALDAMMPHVSVVHVKDHVMIEHGGTVWVQGVPMGQGRLPIMDLTDRLYDGGLRRFCFENVWAYRAPIVCAQDDLPTTPSFALGADTPYLWGDDLDRDVALAGEMDAFHQGWNWMKQALGTGGYEIVSHET
jgi:3-oxoisoapionate decarboxylase